MNKEKNNSLKHKTAYVKNSQAPVTNSLFKFAGSTIMSKESKMSSTLEPQRSFSNTYNKNATSNVSNVKPPSFISQNTLSSLSKETCGTSLKFQMNSPNIKQISKQTNSYFLNKVPINIEDLLIQEERLWMILTCIRFGTDYSIAAEDYLEFSHITYIQTFDTFLKKKKIKEDLRINSINEYISVMLSIMTIITNKLCEVSITHIKNIIYYLHQNFLLIISIILSRIDKEYLDNMWGNKLKEIVFTRLSPEFRKDSQTTLINPNEHFFIKQNNGIIANMLKNYIDIYFRGNNPIEVPIYKFVSLLLSNKAQNPALNIWYVKSTLTKIKIEMINTLMISQAMKTYSIQPPVPYLPPIDKKTYKYSLVLDLDETLVHSIAETGKSLIRPYAELFLRELAPFYEIIIFTAAVKDYADNLLDSIDKEKQWIKYRLYRQHTIIMNNANVKDISKLGRDSKKVIIIDNISDNFHRQSENGIFITTWLGNEKDTELYDLIPVLKEIVVKKVKDVRKILRKFRDTLIRLYVKGDEHPLETLKRMIEENKKKEKEEEIGV